jgi:hypothetical protein
LDECVQSKKRGTKVLQQVLPQLLLVHIVRNLFNVCSDLNSREVRESTALDQKVRNSDWIVAWNETRCGTETKGRYDTAITTKGAYCDSNCLPVSVREFVLFEQQQRRKHNKTRKAPKFSFVPDKPRSSATSPQTPPPPTSKVSSNRKGQKGCAYSWGDFQHDIMKGNLLVIPPGKMAAVHL